ncbi:MAG: hypothetical protein D3911_04445 [Candidatus Electrothrix sp. AW3_4]|nr:hypothetical protein [Candidatus Electrothrix gigas]
MYFLFKICGTTGYQREDARTIRRLPHFVGNFSRIKRENRVKSGRDRAKGRKNALLAKYGLKSVMIKD